MHKMFGGTGSLLYTLMPPKRRKRWINLRALDVTASGVTPTGPDVPVGDTDPTRALTRDLVRGPRPTSSLHIVYFTDPNDEDTVYMNSIQSSMYVMKDRYNEMNFHQYPCLDNDWPAPMIANIRDAALLSQNLPEGYTIDDVLLFIQERKGQSPYELTGHALACILAAHETGSSIDIVCGKDNVSYIDLSNGEENETGLLPTEDRDNKDNNAIKIYKNLTFACTCRFVLNVSESILEAINDHEADPEDVTADARLLNKLIGIMER